MELIIKCPPSFSHSINEHAKAYKKKKKKKKGKYLTTMTVAIFSGMKRIYGGQVWLSLWIIFSIFGVVYASSWDLFMDWGLLNVKSKNYLLRDTLMYKRKWIYYLAMPLNVVLRCAWVLTLAENTTSPVLRDYFLALLEIYRRFQWNFFRLENEHVNNVGKYRATKSIPLPFTTHRF